MIAPPDGGVFCEMKSRLASRCGQSPKRRAQPQLFVRPWNGLNPALFGAILDQVGGKERWHRL